MENRNGDQTLFHHFERLRGCFHVVHDFVWLGADRRSVHVPFHRRVADKNDKRDYLRVQIYCIRFARVLCTLGNLFLECDVHVFRGRRGETFSGTRRAGGRSDCKRRRTEIKDRDQTPSTGVEVSGVQCTVYIMVSKGVLTTW